MNMHLIDGTYELFRHFFGVPATADVSGQEVGAVRGVIASVLSMIEHGATHIGVATDHVVESFRNDLYPGYKTSEGVPPELLSQFPILEEALEAMGVVVWPMVYFEADDALASAAGKAARVMFSIERLLKFRVRVRPHACGNHTYRSGSRDEAPGPLVSCGLTTFDTFLPAT